MADRTVSVNLVANVKGFISGMQTATKAASDFTAKGLDKVGQNEQHIRTLTNTVGALGLALTGAAVLAIKSFADFDQQISNVAATGEDAKSNLNGLRQAALDAGRDTAYSAKEAAGGIEELLKAGVSAKDVLGGGLSGALSLAAAGELDVGDAAEIAATAMTQFKLEGTQVNHVADLLSSGAAKAQGGVSDLGMALKQSGLVAHATGLTIEETTAGLAAFASAGLIGSDAGTSFKSMLQRLTPQSEQAQQAMDDLGISAYDSQGQFIGLAKFAGNLRESLHDLTPEQRNAALATIFGSDAVRAANVLYDEGAAGIEKWTAAVDDQGFAAETAATRLDNLNGDLKILQGSIQTALIEMGSAGDGPLRSLVQEITNVVNAFAELPDAIQGTTLGLVGGGGLILLGVAGLGKLLIAVNSVKEAMTALKISAGLAAGAAGGLAIAAVGIGLLVSHLADAAAKSAALKASLDEVSGAATDITRKLVAENLSNSHKIFGIDFGDSALAQAEALGIGLDELTDAAVNGGEAMDTLNTKLDSFTHQTAENDAAAEELGLSWIDLSDHAKLVKEQVGDQHDALIENGQAVRDVASAADAAGGSQDDLAEATHVATGAVEEQTSSIEDLIKAQSDAAGIVLSTREAQRQFQASIDDATAALEKNKAGLDINTASGRENQAALDDIAESGLEVVDSMQKNGAAQADLETQVQTTRDAFILAAQQFGATADEANALADQMGLIPKNISTEVTLDTNGAAVAIDQFIRNQSARSIQLRVDADPSYSPAKTVNSVRRARGGSVWGAGTATSDSINARLSNGEFVVNAASAHANRSLLEAINGNRFVPGFAAGGTFGGGPSSSGGAGVALNITGNIYARDDQAVAGALLTKTRDTIAAFGIESLGVS